MKKSTFFVSWWISSSSHAEMIHPFQLNNITNLTIEINVSIFLISLKSLDLMSRMRVNDREEEINANFNRSHLCKHREAPSLTYLTNFFCSSSFSRTSVQTAVNCARRVKILARLCLPIVSFRRITRRTNQNHRLWIVRICSDLCRERATSR